MELERSRGRSRAVFMSGLEGSYWAATGWAQFIGRGQPGGRGGKDRCESWDVTTGRDRQVRGGRRSLTTLQGRG